MNSLFVCIHPKVVKQLHGNQNFLWKDLAAHQYHSPNFRKTSKFQLHARSQRNIVVTICKTTLCSVICRIKATFNEFEEIVLGCEDAIAVGETLRHMPYNHIVPFALGTQYSTTAVTAEFMSMH